MTTYPSSLTPVAFGERQKRSIHNPVGYLYQAIAVTIAFNVPLNDALASVKPDSPEGATLWARYLTNWTFWNHVRTIASLTAAGLFTVMPLK